MAPRDAFFAEQEVVPLADGAGRIAAESLAAYPPGIPNVLPGERLEPATLAFITETLAHGGHLRGASDRSLATIRVVKGAMIPRRGRMGRSAIQWSDPAEQVPRISGIRTFARRPHTRELDGVDVAVVGVPFDTGASYRTGTRFGPEAIRSASTLLREHDPALGVDTLEALDDRRLGRRRDHARQRRARDRRDRRAARPRWSARARSR